MCGGGVRSILLLPLVARCLETIDVCIWRMFVCMSVVVTVGVCGNVCCEVVLSGFSKRLFCFVQAKTLCMYGCMYFLAALVLVCVDVIVMSSA